MPTLAYVSNSNKVSIINTSTNTVVNTVTIEPADNITKLIAITPDGSLLMLQIYITSCM